MYTTKTSCYGNSRSIGSNANAEYRMQRKPVNAAIMLLTINHDNTLNYWFNLQKLLPVELSILGRWHYDNLPAVSKCPSKNVMKHVPEAFKYDSLNQP